MKKRIITLLAALLVFGIAGFATAKDKEDTIKTAEKCAADEKRSDNDSISAEESDLADFLVGTGRMDSFSGIAKEASVPGGKKPESDE
jgi:hypothetical protein